MIFLFYTGSLLPRHISIYWYMAIATVIPQRPSYIFITTLALNHPISPVRGAAPVNPSPCVSQSRGPPYVACQGLSTTIHFTALSYSYMPGSKQTGETTPTSTTVCQTDIAVCIACLLSATLIIPGRKAAYKRALSLPALPEGNRDGPAEYCTVHAGSAMSQRR
jgi:hypothetical protein